MHRLFTILLVLSFAVPCFAADEPKPNTLTPKEIAEGWILLFDGDTNFGWTTEGGAKIKDGVWLLGQEKAFLACSTISFGDFEFTFDYRLESKSGAAFHFRRPVAPNPGTPLTRAEEDGWCRCVGEGYEDSAGTTYINHLTEYSPSGKTLFKSSLRAKAGRQKHRICFWVDAGGQLGLRNIKLKPLGTKPVFNGKDLSAWKKFESDPKRAKSRFTVTKEGWLSINSGPGDLQTADEWADFVLQLDCRTNGDNLNSGVFFRCIPGQYQNGYEAQIQNQIAKKPKTYTIDEYNPKTHELKAKKKIENWSQDYGTGAIYRRIPARRAVARDREWFTMTVVAHGRHIATWVNGIQVVDWDDNRPENENPRNGCRLKKGPISLQGHDPTTDLNFRNIRIADLSKR